MPHFKAFGMRNLQYEIETCHKIHNKGTISRLGTIYFSFTLCFLAVISQSRLYYLNFLSCIDHKLLRISRPNITIVIPGSTIVSMVNLICYPVPLPN